nr:hypothetical protein [Kutzneria sp. 744]
MRAGQLVEQGFDVAIDAVPGVTSDSSSKPRVRPSAVVGSAMRRPERW